MTRSFASSITISPEPPRRSGQALLHAFVHQVDGGAVQAAHEAVAAGKELAAEEAERRCSKLRDDATRLQRIRLIKDFDATLVPGSISRNQCSFTGESRTSLTGIIHCWAVWTADQETRLAELQEEEQHAQEEGCGTPGGERLAQMRRRQIHQLEREREVVSRLVGGRLLDVSWLGHLSWLEDAASGFRGEFAPIASVNMVPEVLKFWAAEDERQLFHGALQDFYQGQGELELLGAHVTDNRVEILDALEHEPKRLEVNLEVRVERGAVQRLVPRALAHTVGEDVACRWAAGAVHASAAVALRGAFKGRSIRGLAEKIYGFLPGPEGAVEALNKVAAERKRRLAALQAEPEGHCPLSRRARFSK